jgi:hypothetical protein
MAPCQFSSRGVGLSKKLFDKKGINRSGNYWAQNLHRLWGAEFISRRAGGELPGSYQAARAV